MSEPSIIDKLIECDCPSQETQVCDLCAYIKPEILQLRAKLQAAEGRCAAVELGFLNAISRADAAEAQMRHNDMADTKCRELLCEERDEAEKQRDRLQAEVARLKEKVFLQKAWHCDYCGQVVEGGCYHDCKEQAIVPKLRTRIAELEAGIAEHREVVQDTLHAGEDIDRRLWSLLGGEGK